MGKISKFIPSLYRHNFYMGCTISFIPAPRDSGNRSDQSEGNPNSQPRRSGPQIKVRLGGKKGTRWRRAGMMDGGSPGVIAAQLGGGFGVGGGGAS